MHVLCGSFRLQVNRKHSLIGFLNSVMFIIINTVNPAYFNVVMKKEKEENQILTRVKLEKLKCQMFSRTGGRMLVLG